MKIPRAYYSVLAVFCIAVVCTGMASATSQTQPFRHSDSAKGPEHQAFDISNVTFQQELVARYQQQGIDVSGLQAAFQSGNVTEVREWVKEHRPALTRTAPAFKGKPGFDLTNTTVQQQMIARYQQEGVDVAGLQNAFLSGNMTEVKEWVNEHRPAAGTKGHIAATHTPSAGRQ